MLSEEHSEMLRDLLRVMLRLAHAEGTARRAKELSIHEMKMVLAF